MKPRKAVHFAVIIDRRTHAVTRVFNPTFEFELDHHHVAEHETMLRLKKTEHRISRRHNGMSALDAIRLIERYGGGA